MVIQKSRFDKGITPNNNLLDVLASDPNDDDDDDDNNEHVLACGCKGLK